MLNELPVPSGMNPSSTRLVPLYEFGHSDDHPRKHYILLHYVWHFPVQYSSCGLIVEKAETPAPTIRSEEISACMRGMQHRGIIAAGVNAIDVEFMRGLWFRSGAKHTVWKLASNACVGVRQDYDDFCSHL